MPHPALTPDAVAVVTGGASGIGLAAATRFAALGLRVCIADLGAERLDAAAARIAAAASGGDKAVMAVETDVGRLADLERLEAAVGERFGGADVLMNNAGIGPGTGVFGPLDAWKKIIGVNLWGVVHGTQVFVPGMIARGRPGLVINTGSKQGITTPPGNPAYNVSKAGVKVFTEALAHELRERRGLPDHGASADPGLRLHRADRRRTGGEAGRGLDAGAGGRLHAGEARGGRLLHPLPGQRRRRGRSTSGGSSGRRATSSRTARRCRAGIRTMARLSRRLPGSGRPEGRGPTARRPRGRGRRPLRGRHRLLNAGSRLGIDGDARLRASLSRPGLGPGSGRPAPPSRRRRASGTTRQLHDRPAGRPLPLTRAGAAGGRSGLRREIIPVAGGAILKVGIRLPGPPGSSAGSS